MKLQNNMITEQTELINDNKEFRENLETLPSNYKNINEKVIEMERHMHRLG